MTLEVSTPALLFPAISLLFLSFTNRFLHLSALIRSLHVDWLEKGDAVLRAQIENLRRRLSLIRAMQMFGAVSLLICVVSMLGVMSGMGRSGRDRIFNRSGVDGLLTGLPDLRSLDFGRGPADPAQFRGGTVPERKT